MTDLFSVPESSGLTWAVAAIVFVLAAGAVYLLLTLLRGRFARLAGKTPGHADAALLSSARFHVVVWALLAGVYFGALAAPLDAGATRILGRALLALFILSATFFAAGVLSLVVRTMGRESGFGLPLTSLTDTAVRIAVILIGTLILLANLGISIAPALTALGVGSLAVALALQDTLSNLFAGFHILATKQIRTGDFVRLDSGQEGYVVDIGWRTTRIRELADNTVIVPNTKLSSAIVTNYFLPEKEMAALVQVRVAYGSDLEQVERVTAEVARETLRETPGGLAEFEPFIRYHTLGDSAIGFTVVLRVREFVDQYAVKHEFIKRLHRRYRREGIEIPLPQRVVHTVQDVGDSGKQQGG